MSNINWDFKDKVVVITGGAKGIGNDMVREFIKAGAKVAVMDKEVQGDGMLYYSGDLTEEERLIDFVGLVIKKFEKIDYLINNACLSKKGLLSGCNFEDFNYVLKVGVVAPYMLTKLFMEHFNEGGSIVNISSSRADMSQADTESYTAAKGGINALTHAMAVSLAGRVRVNSVSPGWIDTTKSTWSVEDNKQHPVKNIGAPIDITKAVMFLCSEDSSFITGENIKVDGGMSRLMIYHGEEGWSYTSE
jgi:NAD(P)-dependent dehydrogenase (short-subunit alcohol dehydrogenase family)